MRLVRRVVASSPEAGRRWLFLGTFLISGALLSFEISAVRTINFIVGPGYIYYAIALAMLGRRYATGELAAANALFAFVYEAGTLVGPLATGAALDIWNPHGFLAVGVVANLLFLAVVILRGRRVGASIARAPMAPAPAAAPVVEPKRPEG